MTRTDYALLAIALFIVLVLFPAGCRMREDLRWSEDRAFRHSIEQLRGQR